MDIVTVDRIDTAHPVLRSELHLLYVQSLELDINVRFTSVFRSFNEQNNLYSIGRRGVKGERKVTNAKGGQSYHNQGLAFDICLLLDNGRSVSWDRTADLDNDGKADWMEFVHLAKSHGYEWGGDWRFKDYPHFQKTFGYHWSELQKLEKDEEGYPIIRIDEPY